MESDKRMEMEDESAVASIIKSASKRETDLAERQGGISLRDRTVPSHVFVELTSLDELSFPTSSSTRIRYTCLSASPHYLAVGSSSGTVYLFSRYAAKYRKSLSSVPVQVIACKEGSVHHVSSSPNEKYLAVATSRGQVSVVSLVGNYPSVVLNNSVHVGQAVSCLSWVSDSSRLYVGDTAGRISASRVGVGRKLRSGAYGACFFPCGESEEERIIFAGRPSGRLWEVDGDGVVYSTHQFHALIHAPAFPLITFSCEFLLTVNGSSLCVVDPKKARIVMLCDFGEDVLEYAVCGCDVFVLTCGDGSLRKVSLLSLPKAVEKLHWRECFLQAAQIMAAYHHLLPKVPWGVELVEKVVMELRNNTDSQSEENGVDESLLADMGKVLSRARKEATTDHKSPMVKSSAIRLPTGVHRVLKVMENSGYDDDFTFRAPSPFRSSSLLRTRSLSSPSVDVSGGGGKRMSLPAPRDSPMTGSRSEDSLMHLLGTGKMETEEEDGGLRDRGSHRVTKSVIPSAHRTEVKPLIGTPETLEEKMLRSLEMGGTKVLDSVEKMADALVNFSMMPNVKQQQQPRPPVRRFSGVKTDISYPKESMSAEHYSASDYWSKPKEPPTPPTPLKPMPEVPSVIQVQRSGKNKSGVVKRRKHHRHAERVDSLGSSKAQETSSSRTSRDLELNNYSNGLGHSLPSDKPSLVLNGNILTSSVDHIPSSQLSTGSKSEYFRQLEPDTGAGNYLGPFGEEEYAHPETEKVSEITGRLCPRCGMHRSWLTVLRMGGYLNDIPVSTEEFLEGGVPPAVRDWMELLSLRCKKERDGGKEKPLCHSCLSAFDLLRGRSGADDLEDSVRKHPADLKVKEVEDVSREAGRVELKSVLLGKRLPSADQIFPPLVTSGTHGPPNFKGDSASDKMLYSTYMNPVYDSSGESIQGSESGEWRNRWPWLRRAPLSGLLTAMAYVIGLKAVLEAIKRNDWLKRALTDDVWLCLGRLCGGRQNLSLPHDILESVLKDSLGERESGRVLSWMEERVGGKESLAIDATQNCPCCTLPLEAKVLRVAIIGFPCGHAFHMICLKNQTMRSRESEEFQCIKCSYLAANVATV